MPAVSVVIPAFNEEGGIARQVRDLERVLAESGWDWELQVVDDGSTDGTARAAEEAGARVARLGRNQGYGAALKAGIRATRGEWILITDADGTYPASAVPGLLREAAGADMIVGARVTARMHTPALRRPARWMLRWYAGLLVRRRIPDLNSGMRLMRRESVERFWDLLPWGFSFTSTITLAMMASGRAVKYAPIDYLARVGKSKIRPADFFRMFAQITRVMLQFYPRRVVWLWSAALWACATALLWPLGAAAAVASSGILCALCGGLAGSRLEGRARLARGRLP